MKSKNFIALIAAFSIFLVFGLNLVSASVSIEALSGSSYRCNWQSDSDYSAHYIDRIEWTKGGQLYSTDSVEYGSAKRITQYSDDLTGVTLSSGETLKCEIWYAADPSVDMMSESKTLTAATTTTPPITTPPTTTDPSLTYVAVSYTHLRRRRCSLSTLLARCS